MGFGRGYQIFEENQHEKTMRPVRKIPPRCYFQFNMKVCKKILLCITPKKYLIRLKNDSQQDRERL